MSSGPNKPPSFAGVNLLAGLSKASSSLNNTQSFSGSSTSISSSSKNIGAVTSASDSEYKKKMRKLNSTFLSYVEKHSRDNLYSFWSEGLEDYITYANEIAAKYGSLESNTEASNITAQSKSSSIVSQVPSIAPLTSGQVFSSFPPMKSKGNVNTLRTFNVHHIIYINTHNITLLQRQLPLVLVLQLLQLLQRLRSQHSLLEFPLQQINSFLILLLLSLLLQQLLRLLIICFFNPHQHLQRKVL